MNRQTRTLVVLAVAVVAAAIASYGMYLAISRRPVQQVEVPTRHAVVAAVAMPVGTLITKDLVKLVPWPAATPLQGGFDKLEDVVGRGLISAVVENEPIVETKVAPREAGAGLPPTIPAGMRAMSVRVNEVIGVAGFVVPGTHVDVMAILPGNNSQARVFVSDVQVLTAGTRIDQANTQNGKPIPTTVVTLLVSPGDAEKIALVQAEGQLMLSLRNPTDVAPTDTKGAKMATLFGAGPVEPEAPAKPRKARPVVVAAPPPAPPKVYTVETIRAAKRSQEVVKDANASEDEGAK